MISRYEIKKINHEEVLYLYMNYDYEFANDLGNIKKQFTLIEQIKNYLKKMKLHFKGKYIVLVIGGITTLTLACSHNILQEDVPNFIPDPQIMDVVDYNIFIPPNIQHLMKSNEIIPSSTQKEETAVKEETKKEQMKETETITSNTINTQKVNASTNTRSTNKKPTIQSTVTQKPSTNQKTTNNTNQNTTTQTNTTPSTTISPIEEKPVTKQTTVTLYRSNGTVETIELETYLIGVVAAEMPASFHSEALKAQAIVARTYALRKIKQGQVLTDTISTQVYKDNNQLKTLWGNNYNTYYNKIKKAVDSTKGLVITYQGNYIDAVFHSTSNGYTVDAIDVWGNDIPYLKSVSSPFDKNASSYLKNQVKQISDLSKNLGITIDENSTIEILQKDKNGRVLQVNIDGNIYTGLQMRQKLGLRSTDFDILFDGNKITFTTRGYGHGVGMSQYGANGMANNGSTYQEIIKHYYTGVKIEKK